MITECPHGMGNPKACFECMEDGPVNDPAEKSKRVEITRIIGAMYDRECQRCGGPVAVNDMIGLSKDDEIWVCMKACGAIRH